MLLPATEYLKLDLIGKILEIKIKLEELTIEKDNIQVRRGYGVVYIFIIIKPYAEHWYYQSSYEATILVGSPLQLRK